VNVGDPSQFRSNLRIDTITSGAVARCPASSSTSTMAARRSSSPRDSDLHRQQQAHDVPSGIRHRAAVGGRGARGQCTGSRIRVGGGLRGDPRYGTGLNATWSAPSTIAAITTPEDRSCRAGRLRADPGAGDFGLGDRAHRRRRPRAPGLARVLFALWRRRRDSGPTAPAAAGEPAPTGEGPEPKGPTGESPEPEDDLVNARK